MRSGWRIGNGRGELRVESREWRVEPARGGQAWSGTAAAGRPVGRMCDLPRGAPFAPLPPSVPSVSPWRMSGLAMATERMVRWGCANRAEKAEKVGAGWQASGR
jgi:hypothetical protein